MYVVVPDNMCSMSSELINNHLYWKTFYKTPIYQDFLEGVPQEEGRTIKFTGTVLAEGGTVPPLTLMVGVAVVDHLMLHLLRRMMQDHLTTTDL